MSKLCLKKIVDNGSIFSIQYSSLVWRKGKRWRIAKLEEVSFKRLPVSAENNGNSVQTWNPGI
jgi:hypothetical protein